MGDSRRALEGKPGDVVIPGHPSPLSPEANLEFLRVGLSLATSYANPSWSLK